MAVRIHVSPAADDVRSTPEWWVLRGGRVELRLPDRAMAIDHAVRLAQAQVALGTAAEVWLGLPGGRSRRHWPAPDESSS